jgi:hypothetical protein
VLELQHAKTTTCAWQLEAQLEAAPVEQFPENHAIVHQSGSRQGPIIMSQNDSNTNADAEAKLMPMTIILCTEVTVVIDEHTLIHKACFICPQNVIVKRARLQCVDVIAINKLHSWGKIIWKQTCIL